MPEKTTDKATEVLKEALRKAAAGYTIQEKRRTVKTHPDGSQTVTEEVTERYIPPNVSAAKLLEELGEVKVETKPKGASMLSIVREKKAAG